MTTMTDPNVGMRNPVSHFIGYTDSVGCTIHSAIECLSDLGQSMGAALTYRAALAATDIPLCSRCCGAEQEDRDDALCIARLLWSERINTGDDTCHTCHAPRVKHPHGNGSTLTHTERCIVPAAWILQARMG